MTNPLNQDNLVLCLKGGSLKNPKWNDQEIGLLKLLYPKLISGEITRTEISSRIGRSDAACACKANEFGITGKIGQYPKTEAIRKKMSASQKARMTPSARKAISVQFKKWHSENPHPKGMLGKKHSKEFCENQSKRTKGTKQTKKHVMDRLKSRLITQGGLAPNRIRGTWKAAWRVIGGQRIFARSAWEANYARYLQFLIGQGEILKWEHEPVTFWFEKIRRGVRSYLPDFRVTLRSGLIEYHEVKGWMDDRSKTKLKRMAKYHPLIKMVVRDSKWFKANAPTIGKFISGWE